MADEERRDFPFKAEYAKSNRSSCKLCRNKIEKECLRLAKMVQSPVFDGKIPNWYHYNCFFKGNSATSHTEIGGFASLRWDDQQRIKDKIAGKETTGPVKSADPDAKTDDTDGSMKQFEVEYAKSNRSRCHKCGDNIDKKEVRIAISLEDDYSKWHHVDCFADPEYQESYLSSWPENSTASMITGFKNLKPADKKMLEEKIGKPKTKKKGSGGPPAKKQKPKLAKWEKGLKEQNDHLWEIRDKLYRFVKSADLRQMLKTNRQDLPTGESKLLDTVADGMMFGALERCPECKKGQLILSSTGLNFCCTGNLTSWTKCQYKSTDVKRRHWAMPKKLSTKDNFLEDYKFEAYNNGKRLFPPEEEMSGPSGSQDAVGDGKRKSAKKPHVKPLHNCKIVLHGQLSKPNKEIKAFIEELGGQTSTAITKHTTCVISTEADVKKMKKKMREAKDNDVHVVSEDFLESVKKGGAALMIIQHNICSWGSDPTSKIADTVVDAPTKSAGQRQREKDEKTFASILPKSSKMKIKGGGVVDSESGHEHDAHVYKQGSTLYSATLGLVDITRGTNSYYKIQLLEHDSRCQYWVFRSWGRVGTTIGGHKLEEYGHCEDDAKTAFTELYKEKTGNKFGTEKFVKYPMKFFPLDISYGDEEDRILAAKERAGKTSKLPKEIQKLMAMIFDLEELKKAMIDFEIDMEKMPLGKLSKKQIQDAYKVLTELQKLVTDKASRTAILDASNRFYTLIPHNFGLKAIPLLDSLDVIQAKTQMLDNLLDIEIAYSLLKQEEGDTERDPIDVHYDNLKCPMEVVDKSSDEFKMIAEYTKNTHAPTHNWYRLEVEEAYRLDREGETGRFKPFKKLHNRQLLWHGSRRTNYGGILSQGLRIAPPEAPATGYMFGKGIYFADMVTKSANYCFTTASNNIGLMLLSEVALGDMYEITHAEGMSKPPGGKHSTKGMGRTCPAPSGTCTIEDNLMVPMGEGTNSSISTSSLLYNEYIVYDIAQVKLRYLMKMKFNYN